MTNQVNQAVTLAVIEWCDSVLSDVENVVDRGCGICTNLEDYLGWRDLDWLCLGAIIRAWPEFSGDMAYPVQCCGAYWATEDKWVGEIGAKRLRLVKHIRDTLLGEM